MSKYEWDSVKEEAKAKTLSWKERQMRSNIKGHEAPPSDKELIIRRYTMVGVPASSLSALCTELNINETALKTWLYGQTMGSIGGESLVYPDDILRFVKGLPVID